MQKVSDNKRRAISNAFNLVVFVFLVTTLSLLLWLLSDGAPPARQTQNAGQDSPMPTVAAIDTPAVTVIETPNDVATLAPIVYVSWIGPVLGVVIDEKQSVVLIEPSSLAEKAGVQLGDVLERVGDIPLTTDENVLKAKEAIAANLDIVMHLTIIRDGVTLDLEFTPMLPVLPENWMETPAPSLTKEPPPTITPVLTPFNYL